MGCGCKDKTILKKDFIQVFIEGMERGAQISLPDLARVGRCSKQYAQEVASDYESKDCLKSELVETLHNNRPYQTRIYTKL